MQSTQVQHTDPQHAEPQNDPHDDIAAILRNEPPPSRASHDPSELRITPLERGSSAATLGSPLDPPLRPEPLTDHRDFRPRRGRRFARFLLTLCVGIAATVGWLSYGEAAREMLATWAPQLVSTTTGQDSGHQAQTVSAAETPAPVQNAETAAPAQPPPAADTAAAPAQTAAPAQAAEPVQAAPAPDLTPMIEGMSREIASLREAVEQLKASQRQMSRELAKAAEQESKRRVAAPAPPPPSRPVAAAPSPRTLPPVQPASQQQVYAPPPPPSVQPMADPGYASVPRPPRALP